MSGKYSQNLLVYAKKSEKYALKVVLKRAIQKVEEDSCDLIVNENTYRITKV